MRADRLLRAAQRALAAEERRRAQERRRVLQAVAAVYADQGMSTAAIARALGISGQTAKAWIVAGRALWSTDPDSARRLVAAALPAGTGQHLPNVFRAP